MRIFIISGSIILPLIMFYLQRLWPKCHLLYQIVAIISLLVFGNIAALAIYKVIIDNTVFMTKIHAIFLNPFFLITGAYLGVFIVYTMILTLTKYD